MASDFKIDEALLEEAFRESGAKTKRETVNRALQEYVLRLRQLKVLQLRGQIDFDPEYDYKAHRDRV